MIKSSKILDAHAINSLVDLVFRGNQRLCEFYQHYQQNHALEITNKQDNSPVTEADMAAHHMIEQGLNQLSPSIPVLSEESSDYELRHQWDTFWLVDPLDGTREFIH